MRRRNDKKKEYEEGIPQRVSEWVSGLCVWGCSWWRKATLT
jgi:hypothetical protein